MDLNQVIHELVKERNGLDALIRALEKGLDPPSPKPAKSRRGRKFMSAGERSDVAERMRRYWAARKGTTAAPPVSGEVFSART
jgi:hypothetical protein